MRPAALLAVSLLFATACAQQARYRTVGELPRPGETMFVGRVRFDPPLAESSDFANNTKMRSATLYFSYELWSGGTDLQAYVEKGKPFAFSARKGPLYLRAIRTFSKLASMRVGKGGAEAGQIHCVADRPLKVDPGDADVAYVGTLICRHDNGESVGVAARDHWSRDAREFAMYPEVKQAVAAEVQ